MPRVQVTRIAFYTRISTDEDKQKYSLDAQRDRLESYCKGVFAETGYEVIETYRDTESGAHLDRPALTRMLADARAGRFDLLLVYRVDRLSRKLSDLAPMVEGLVKIGVSFRSVSESFDTASPSGRAMMQLLGVFGELERETIIERTKMGMEKKARTGVWVGGAVPYGYRIREDKKGIVVFEDEATIIRKIFSMYAEGLAGVQSIRDELTAAGYRKRKGKRWDPRTLLHVLRNPVYVGKIRWKGALHDGKHEPIVSQVTFDRAAAVLAGRSEESKGRQWHNGSERLLTGVANCARCGAPMLGVSGRKNGVKSPYYACRNRLQKAGCRQEYIRATDLEEVVVAEFRAHFRNEVFVESVWAEANRMLTEGKPEVEAELLKAKNDAVAVQERLDRYFAAFEDGSMDSVSCRARIGELNATLAALTATRRELETRLETMTAVALDKAEIAVLLDDFDRLFEAGSNPIRKNLLHKLVKEVRVHSKSEAEVWYRFPRPVEAASATDSSSRGDRTLTHLAPQIGQCTNRVSRWEYAVVVRVVLRIPCEAGLEASRGAIHGSRRRVRRLGNVGAHGRVPAWLTEAGPAGQIAPVALNTEARPRIGAELLR
jgi:site-specific DNA recombinase